MNYVPVDAGTNSTNFSGTKDAPSQEVKKDVSSLRYIALSNWVHDALLESSLSKPQDESSTKVPKGSGNPNPTASTSNPPADQIETLIVESPIPTVSSPVPTACLNDSPKPSSKARLILKRVANQEETPSLNNILSLTNRFEDIHGVESSLDKAIGVEADVSDALQDPSRVEAMQEELLQFKIQNVWTLVDCPKGVRPIGTKWVLKNKKDKKGIVIRNMARLMAQGQTQEEGIDYDEVFALVARIEAIRLFLAYASFMGFTVYQMDVKGAFLYGTIDEEVYVMQAPGFHDLEFPAKVYKVEKAMDTIDQTLFIKRKREDFILVQVNVDDIIFGSSNPQLCREFEALMHKKFQMSAMGELNFFLGLQVLQKEDGIFLSHDKYVGDILKKFGYSDVRSSNTPMDKEYPWGKDETGKVVDLHLYRSMIGSLMYLTASRPDIMFAICAYARHQTIVATSTTEAEYVAAASCCGQVLWIQNQLLDYGYNFMNTKIYIDNNSTKDAANQEVKKDVSYLRYIALPNWAHDALLESSSSMPHDESSSKVPEGSGNPNSTISSSNSPANQIETLTVESPIPNVSSPVLTACLNDSPEPSSEARLVSKRVANQEETPSLDNILSLTNRFEEILGVTTSSNEAVGVEADVSNMETTISASPTPTLGIHKDYPKSQIIGPVDTPIQTSHKSKEVEEQSFIATLAISSESLLILSAAA
nr:retrovirus-related Pol polyprotein from transposon TNT 1-94 [Tanacetum cinerariifolium]